MDASIKIFTGTHVDIELIDRSGNVESLSLDIVPDKQADFSHGYLGEGTPLARALAGHSAGDEVPYVMAEIVKVRILSVQRTTESPPEDAAAQREATLRKAKAEIERRNAITFASSFSGKWGDYDPDGVEKWDLED